MTEDLYVVAIVALLPLTACMLVFQVNPYHALIIRGILGAVAALVYALFGAADVALTEALVGTMLSITLYAVAVRSSMSMRLGILEQDSAFIESTPEHIPPPERLLPALRKLLRQHHMRLELVPYNNVQALQTALDAKEIHAVCTLSESGVLKDSPSLAISDEEPLYHLKTRIRRLYDLMEAELPMQLLNLSYLNLVPLAQSPDVGTPNPVEIKS